MNNNLYPRILLVSAVFGSAALTGDAATVRLDQLDLGPMSSGWGKAQRDQSVTQTPLSVAHVKFVHGVGTHACSELWLRLDGNAKEFTAKVGVDDNARDPRAAIEFFVYGNDRVLWHSGVCKLGEAPRDCRVDLSGVKTLALVVANAAEGIAFDHSDWADAAFSYDGAAPVSEQPKDDEAGILTPAPSAKPELHGPKVYGVRPGSPFLYRIPCTGTRPITFSATGLPDGLALDSNTGIISGSVQTTGTFRAELAARSNSGESQREFRIVAGDQLALTPPMGWNSWYILLNNVSEGALRQAADQMIASGMADYGYQYVNIDDCWMKKRGEPPYNGANGAVLPNTNFPDIKGMVDYIHGKGLKAGIYTSPGPWTCGQYAGAYQHEAEDARQFAQWGFDFLKYDWCSYTDGAGGSALENLERPYALMWGELKKQNRNIVFNLCQYGMGDVWKWGAEMGNCWRTTGDLGLEPGGNLPGFYNIGFKNEQHAQYARPGAWNDPDYILIGWVGDARGMGRGTPTSLTPNEQYSYMSMWSLMAAPLIFSGDMAKLDPFTLNILCNADVIDVNQDTLGKQASILRKTPGEFVLVKELEDGSRAVGLFNLGTFPSPISVSWTDLGLAGKQMARDLWRQKDLGVSQGTFSATVPRHGVVYVRLSPSNAL